MERKKKEKGEGGRESVFVGREKGKEEGERKDGWW